MYLEFDLLWFTGSGKWILSIILFFFLLCILSIFFWLEICLCIIWPQVERVEYRLCEEYAQFLCYGTGSIWVSSVTFNPWIVQSTCIYGIFGCILLDLFLNVAGFKFLFVFPSQVQEDELWNHFEPMGNDILDNALHKYTKQRAVETMGKLLEMRLSSHGYIVFSWFLISMSILALWLLVICFLRLLLRILLMSHIGWRSLSVQIYWQSITSHIPVAFSSGSLSTF